MKGPDQPDVTHRGRSAWLDRLLGIAESAAGDLRARDDPSHANLIEDLDDLCLRLRSELDDTKST
jgi:hypothetical protein